MGLLEVANGELILEFVNVGTRYNKTTHEKYRLRHGDLYLSEWRNEVENECGDYSIVQIDILNSLASLEEGVNICDDDGDRPQIRHKDIYEVIYYPIGLMHRNENLLKVKNVATNEIIEYRQF